MRVFDALNQLIFRQRRFQIFDIAIALVFKGLHRTLVQAFQQQYFDFVFGQRKFFHVTSLQ